MFIELLIAATIEAQSYQGPSNTIPLSTGETERWPGPVGTSGRWMNAPSGKTPFLVVTSTLAGEIAVRWAVDPTKRGTPAALYYVAMRQTADALQEADSRECAIAPVMADLRALPTPEIIVPGTFPVQALAGPPFGHGGVSVAFSGARQLGGEYADLVIAGTSGPIVEWVPKLFEATNDCWKPMAPPEPVAPPLG